MKIFANQPMWCRNSVWSGLTGLWNEQKGVEQSHNLSFLNRLVNTLDVLGRYQIMSIFIYLKSANFCPPHSSASFEMVVCWSFWFWSGVPVHECQKFHGNPCSSTLPAGWWEVFALSPLLLRTLFLYRRSCQLL